MIKYIWRRFLKLRMKYQIMTLETIGLITTLLFIMGAYLIQSNLFLQIVKSASSSIVITQQEITADQSYLQTQQYLLNKQQNAISTLTSVSQLFQYSKLFFSKYSINTGNLHQPCLFQNQTTLEPILWQVPQFCYQVLQSNDYNTLPSSSEALEFYIKTISLLNLFALTLDVQFPSQLAISNTPINSLFYAYPKKYIFLNYTVSSRPWYKYHIQQLNKFPDSLYFFSPTFLSVTGGFFGGISFQIQDQQNKMIGLMEFTIAINDQLLYNFPITYFLTNLNGQVMASNFNVSNTAYYIYNESITGFNITDWIAMFNHSIQLDMTTTLCNQGIKSLCLYNKLYKQEVFVESKFVESLNCTLIIYGNVTFQIELDKQFNMLLFSLSQKIVENIQIQLGCCFILIIMSGLAIHILFIPLFHLMQIIKEHSIQIGNNINKEFFKLFHYKQKSANIFYQFGEDFYQFSNQINGKKSKKSEICTIIENIQYNIKDKTQTINDIKTISQEISDFNYEQPNFYIWNNLQNTMKTCTLPMIFIE